MKAILFLAAFVYFADTASATNYYFSSQSGNDSRSNGEAQNPSTPWRTLSKLNSIFSSLRAGDAVLLKRGETFYGSIVVRQSGSASSPITIGAYGSGSRPVITSLVTLGGWTSKGGGVWEASNSSLGSEVNMVVVNGVEQEMGRYPNSNAANRGYLNFESHSGRTSITDNQLNTSGWSGAELVTRPRHWILNRARITGQSGHKISYTTNSPYEPYEGYGYFIQNSAKTLDKFGEWYYNPSGKKLSVFFGSGGPSNVQAATTSNDLISSSNCSNVTFDNLTIKGSNGSGFFINNGSNIHIQNCDILFSGITGAIVHGHTGLHVENCNIANSNNNGIDMEYNVKNAVIRNNTILNTGTIPGLIQNGEGTGLAIYSNGEGAIIEGNQIRNTGFIGITFYGNNITIRNNLIDQFCYVKDDGGALYSHGESKTVTNRKLLNNIIMNGTGAGPGTDRPTKVSVNGIYLDANVVNVEITGNTVTNCYHGVFLQSTQGITVKNNTFYDNSNQMSILRRPGRNLPKNNNLTQNYCFAKTKDQHTFYAYTSANDIGSFGTFDYNYYARPVDDGKTIFVSHISGGKAVNEELDLSTWQKRYGKDAHTKKSPLSLANTASAINSSINFQYNATGSAKSVSLNGSFIDVTGKRYSNSTILQPYTSLVLIRTSGGTGGGNQAPDVSLTDPLDGQGFGAPASIKINAVADDGDGSVSKVEFFNGNKSLGSDNSSPYSFSWNNVPAGTYTITAKATDNDGASTVSSSVVISVTSGSGGSTLPVVNLTSPANNATFSAPGTITISANASDDGSVSKVQFFSGSTLLKTESTPPYTFKWQNVPAGNYIITAVATDNDGLTNTSDARAVTVGKSGTTGGAPVIALISPVDNASFGAPASITISATASDPNGSINKVEFFNGSKLLNTQKTSPYTFVWNNVAAGNYTITAKATDDDGLTSTSTASVSVGSVNTVGAPAVTITSPANKASFSNSASITLTAAADDADGSIKKVEFFDGTTLLNTQQTSPYTYVWKNASSGSHKITAKASDNDGHVTTSASVSVSVGSQSAARSSSSQVATSGSSAAAISTSAVETTALTVKPDPSKPATLRLLPNPAVNTVQIYFEGLQTDQKAQVTLYNAEGAILKKYTANLPGKKIDVDVSSYSTGTYFVSLSTDHFTITKKFLKIK